MKKTKEEKLQATNFWWNLYRFISKIVAKTKAHYKINKDNDFDKRNKNEGTIILYNHACNIDHFISTAFFNKNKINYVVTRRFDYSKSLHKAFILTKSIVRDQFKTDLASILKMKKVVSHGGNICIAPAGQVTIHGGEPYIPDAIVKLVKMCKVDVYVFKSYGTYLNYPKWSSKYHGYPVYVTCDKILSKDDLNELDNDLIYQKIVDELNIEDRIYQQNKMIKLKKKHNLSIGLENVFYECPKCKTKYQIITRNNDIICENCENKFTYNRYGYLENDEFKDFNETKWYNFQEDEIATLIKNGNYHLESKVKLYTDDDAKSKIIYGGEGKLVCDNDNITYFGTYLGKEIIKKFNLDLAVQFPFKPNTRFNIPDEEALFEFVPENLKEVSEWSQIPGALLKIKGVKNA